MKKKIIYGLLSLVILVGAFALSGYLVNAKPEPKKDAKKHNVTYVKADHVTMTETETDMAYRGRVTAFDNVSLSAEVSGKILKGEVRFKEGESFSKGQVLVRIYSLDVEAALKSGKSSLLQTISQILPDLKVDYAEQYDKWMTFFNAIDVQKSLPALPAIESNKEKVFLASNNVLSSYYTLQQKEINLERYTIIAPFNGSFTSVNKEIGAVSSPGSELAMISRTDKMEVTVPVWPSDLAYIAKGDEVAITNHNGTEKMATVARIASFVDAASQSVNVYLTYNASSVTGFLEGEYVDVSFEGDSVNGFEIPREALFDGNCVYALKEGKLEMIKVEVLRQMDDYYIISGMAEEVMVVTESMASINPETEYKSR